ncbi:MAG: AbrB family transcriptional regulator [Desulfovibrionaceae bacterium]
MGSYSPLTNILLTLAAATGGGLIMTRFKMPGGVLIGAMVAVVALKYLRGAPMPLPTGSKLILEILVGASVGVMFENEMIPVLKTVMGPVFISAFAVIAVGLIVAVFMIKMGLLDPGTAYISTSPGAMTAMLGMATSLEVNVPIVLVFHFVRIMLIIATAPLILKVMRFFTP